MAKNPRARDAGSIPESGLGPGGGSSSPLRYSCLENPTDRGAWWAAVHGVAKSRTGLSRAHTQGGRIRVWLLHLSVSEQISGPDCEVLGFLMIAS